MKLVSGRQSDLGFWIGPEHPNSSSPYDATGNWTGCTQGMGCLSDLKVDPTEHTNLLSNGSSRYVQVAQTMLLRMRQLANDIFPKANATPYPNPADQTCMSPTTYP